MRVVVGIATAVIMAALAGTPADARPRAADTAQAPAAEKKPPSSFSGVKLVDLKARKPETTVSLKLAEEAMSIIDPAAKKEVANLKYNGLTATHILSPAPPEVAGDPSAVATQPMAPPMYMGKTPRHWLTLTSGSDTVVLRVSEKVYDNLKVSLASHNVQVVEGK